ncbi:MAG: cell division protein FtsL [Gammaproteobacteria bacterium]
MNELHLGFQVRQYKPWKIWLTLVLVTLLLWLFFILGQIYQSYELLHLKLERETLVSQIDELESRNHNLVKKNAQLSSISRIESSANVLANKALIKLQQELLEQKEELVFYQSIVSPKDVALGINLQTLEVKPKGSRGLFSYKMVLTKRGEGNKKVTGTAQILIRGEDKDGTREFLLSEIELDKSVGDIKFSFRYFQVFEGEFSFIEDFEPYELEVSVVSSTKKIKSFTESISWARVLSEDS